MTATTAWRRCAAPLLLVVTSACVPIVSHSPRVEPGFSGGLQGGLTGEAEECVTHETRDASGNRRSDRHCARQAEISGYLSLRRGWARDSLSSGTSLGVNLPMFPHPVAIAFAEADLYHQLRRTHAGSLERGGGVLLSAFHLAPYVQVGRTRADGGGWYTTQLLSLPLELYGGEISGAGELRWVPSLTRGIPLRGKAEPGAAQVVARVHLIGTLGKRFYSQPTGATTKVSATLALSLERFRRR